MSHLRSALLLFALHLCAGPLPVATGVPAGKEKGTPGAVVEWARAEEFAGNSPHNPLAVRGKVIVGTDDGEVRAYRSDDGEPLWVHSHGNRIFHRPSSDGERVFFTSSAGLTALSLKDGSRLWALGLAHCDGPPLAVPGRGMVCVGGHDGNLYAADAKTGRQLWRSDYLTDAPADPPGFPGARARMTNTKARPSALASDGDAIFLSVFDQCRVVAFAAADGKRLWDFQSKGWVYGAALPTDDRVFFGSQDRHVYCLDKRTGAKVWDYKTEGRIESGGAAGKGHVYFASCDGSLYCLKQSDGGLRWRFRTAPPEGATRAIYSTPLLGPDAVYFAAGEGRAYSVRRRTGERRWEVRPSEDSQLFCSPASDGKRLFFVTRVAGKGRGEASLLSIGEK